MEERIESAEILLEAGNYRDSLSRSYYAILDLVRGLLEIKKVVAVTHKGAITKFSQVYIKSGEVDKKFGRVLSKIQKQREDADYKFKVKIDKDKATQALSQAKEFVSEVKKLLS